jgi:hypothetical protein
VKVLAWFLGMVIVFAIIGRALNSASDSRTQALGSPAATSSATTNAVKGELGSPPSGFRNFKWGASPRSSLKKYSGPTDEGLTMYVPILKKSEPLFGIPVVEEDYFFAHGRFYQGDVFLDGEPNLQKMKATLVQAFGDPTFTNDNLKIWKWNWPKKSIEIQLHYQDKFARTTVTFSNSAIE